MTKHRSPDERAEQILAAARQCFLENGYFATRMDEIARESGLSKGGIYFHFDSKKDIFRSLVEMEYENAMEFIEGVIGDSESDIASIIADVGRHFTERFASTDAPRFMAIIAEMGLRDEEIRDMLLQLQESYIDRLAEVLREGVEEGRIKDIDPESTAILMKAIIDGLQAGYGIGYDPDIDRLVQTSMRVLGTGILKEEDE